MKEYWTYRKFEDCLEKVKYTSKISTSDYLTEGEYPIVSQEEGLIAGFWNNEADVFRTNKPVVIFGDHTRVLKYVDFDFVLGADGVKILQPIDDLSAKFFLYYLKWYNIPSLGYSRHYKLLKEIKIPIPPLSTQSRIVSELDLLQSIIDKQKAQVKELDNLAQAIFYDMFGDPVENEKGWEVKKLGEIGKIVTGNTPSRQIKEYYDTPFIEWIKSDNLSNNYIYASKAKEFLSKSGSSKGRIIPTGSILVTCIAGSLSSIGTASMINRTVSFNQQINAIIPNEKLVSNLFVLHTIRRMGKRIQDNATNGMKHIITKSVFKNIPIILPPLSLQQTFAAKIESIEKQKAAISKSLAETQRLFDYTMDKYFG